MKSLKAGTGSEGNLNKRLFINRSGLRLCLYSWSTRPNGTSRPPTTQEPTAPKGAVLLLHGITSHARFEYLSSSYQHEMDVLWHQKIPSAAPTEIGSPTASTAEMSVVGKPTVSAAKDQSIAETQPNPSTVPQTTPVIPPPQPADYQETESTTAGGSASKCDPRKPDEPGVMSDLYFTSSGPHLAPRSKSNACDQRTQAVSSPKKTPILADHAFGLSQEDTPTITEANYRLIYEHSWVAAWQQHGYTVFALDLQGHGLSDGWKDYRCNVYEFDDFAYDVVDIIREIRNDLPPKLPLFAVGISMGGAVLSRALELGSASGDLQRNTLRGAVLLAPALSLQEVKRKPINSIIMPFARVLSAIYPSGKVVPLPKNEKYPHIIQYCTVDSLVYTDRIPVRIAVEILKAIDEIHRSASQINPHISILFCHSIYDTMCDPRGSLELYRNLQVEDKELWHLHGMWHFLTKEPGANDLLSCILKWCDHRL